MSQETLRVQSDFPVPAEAAGWQRRSLIVGVVGALLCVAGVVTSLDQFMRGYLIAYMFWLGLSLGCLALLMVQYLSGGLWGLSIRRVLESASKCLPLMFILFLPILFLRHNLYEWMEDPSLTEHNHWYLNTPGWIGRWVVYFVIWIGLAYVLNRRGDKQDQPLSASSYPRFQGFSGIGLVLYALTVSFAAVDWIMSLDPHWGSTIYGLIFIAGQ